MASKKRGLWDKWMALSMKGAGVLLLILLYIFYFTLFVPMGLIYIFVSDPLRRKLKRKDDQETFFVDRTRLNETRETAGLPY